MRDIILSSSVLIIAILSIRTLIKGKISARLQYALWLLVVARLVIPGTIGDSPISVQHLVRFSAGAAYETELEAMSAADIDSDSIGAVTVNTDAGISAYLDKNREKDIGNNTNTNINTEQNAQVHVLGNAGGNTETTIKGNTDRGAYDFAAANEKGGLNDIIPSSADTAGITVWRIILYVIWIFGVVITGGYMLLNQIRFARYLAINRKPLQGKNREYRGLKVYTVSGLPSPCLCGRRIYTDSETAEDERKLNHILAHEYCHYRQFDPLWAYVRCILVSVYWFHPLVWAAAYISKRDSEFACDEAALKLLGEKERYEYGRTLLGLVSPATSKLSDIGPLLTVSSGEKGMRERIGRIAGRPKTYMLAGGMVLVLAAVFAVITFTGAGREPLPELAQEGDADAAANGENTQEEVRILAEQAEKVKTEADRLADERKQLERLIEDEKARQDAILQAEEQIRRRMEELAEQKRVMQVSQSVIGLLSSYDERILSRDFNTAGNLPGAMMPRYSDIWSSMHTMGSDAVVGEDAISEGIYYLAGWSGKEWQSRPYSDKPVNEDIISIYGLYTKEYGLRGVKIMVGKGVDKDVNDFDIPWSFVGEKRIGIFETNPEDAAPDGLPRTFVFKQLVPGSEAAYIDRAVEGYELYVCDRYDTGHIELSKIGIEDFVPEVMDRVSCEVDEDEKSLSVAAKSPMPEGVIYTEGLDLPVEFEEIREVIIDPYCIDYWWSENAEDLQMSAAIDIKVASKESGELWHHDLPQINYRIDSDGFGPSREFILGPSTPNIPIPSYTKPWTTLEPARPRNVSL